MTNVICPECHLGWYVYYIDDDNQEIEGTPLSHKVTIPVAVKSSRGYLCVLCRHEWKEDGTPVSQEDKDRETAYFRKHGKERQVKIHGCPHRVSGSKCYLDNNPCDSWMLSICEIRKQINQSLQGKAN